MERLPCLPLHARLIADQSIQELQRKALKACCGNSKLWTQEELDVIERVVHEQLQWWRAEEEA